MFDIQAFFEGNLTQEERQFVIAHIPPAYDFSPKYLRALGGLALHSFDVIDPVRRRELVFALLFVSLGGVNQLLTNF